MPRQAICIEELTISEYDENGFVTEVMFQVPAGSVFNYDENTHRVIGGVIRLENDDYWIEISEETFKKYFREVRNV